MDRQPRAVKVKNKNPAEIQITAEQILRESKERQDNGSRVPQQKIADLEEMDEHKLRKRKEFEDGARRSKHSMGNWIKYAAWEESHKEMDRARSIWERALDVDHRSQVIWLKYAEMEMKHKNINRARNIFDRAVTVLPRVDTFWYKYVYMEELLDNIAGARQVFERWMKWEPAEECWMAYVAMEKRYKELHRARDIFRRFVGCHPQPKNWIKWAKFEESIGKPDSARAIYEQCLDMLGEDFIDQNIYVSFAKFETRQKEIERARVIYKYALQKLAKGQTENLYNMYTQFEKQHGEKQGIEDVIIGKRRVRYEDELAANPRNYDVWFDYVRLEESAGDHDKIRELYERAIAQVPLIGEKRFWRRYIYLWIFYAVWEELEGKDMERTKQIYQQCLKVIPHKQFTFAKVWLLFAKFLIRQMDLPAARKNLGAAIGMAPKERLFKGYIELELQLREFDRVRALYERYLQWNASNCYAWIKFAELERMLGDTDRSRGIFEIAVEQPVLDMPEVLWKGYIDFEVQEAEWARARSLYNRLLQRTEHVKVWISYAIFENTALDHGEEPSARAEVARKIFSQAYTRLQRLGDARKEERVVLLDAWSSFESTSGDAASLAAVKAKMPRAVKRRRRVVDEETGEETNAWEEYYDYIFPDDETERPNFKLLAIAHEWKQKMAAAQNDDDDSDDRDEEESEDGSADEAGGAADGGEPAGKKARVAPPNSDGDDDDAEAPGAPAAKRGRWEAGEPDADGEGAREDDTGR
ncbi:Crooked neck-like protein 1 [Geranomyces variabilis]|nr:Crooked neck-like protein 1 [Geranomyces variabilis]